MQIHAFRAKEATFTYTFSSSIPLNVKISPCLSATPPPPPYPSFFVLTAAGSELYDAIRGLGLCGDDVDKGVNQADDTSGRHRRGGEADEVVCEPDGHRSDVAAGEEGADICEGVP